MRRFAVAKQSRTPGMRAGVGTTGTFGTLGTRKLPLTSQFQIIEPQRVADHRNRAESHRDTRNDRAEEHSEKGIE